ncbi:MAG TPA: ABC transporter permease [Terracidiphilus sp.]|nr:ABC transporter permease [Terracidiphilus sp.]
MTNLWLDIRYALRQLRKSPGFTLTVVLTLALGIGANTAIFTLVQGVLLRSLPVADPSQLYRIGDNNQCCVDGGFPEDSAQTGDFSIFSFDLAQHLKQSAPEFEQLAAVEAGIWDWTVRRGNELAKSLHGEFVSGNYFATLGLSPSEGRLFAEADDTEGAAPALVLSYQAWQGEYAGDPSIVGSTIYVQAKPFTVIGIAPPGFFGDRVTDNPPEFWMPIHAEPYVEAGDSILHNAESHWLYLLGRVHPGTNIAALQAKLTVALRQWLWSRPHMVANGGAALIPRQHVVLTPAGGGIRILQNETEKGLTLLMILSTVVLLIACANIANLMLARATRRRAEIALRSALGAARPRILRGIFTESILLACIGGLAGLAVAYGGGRMILAFAFADARNLPISANPSLTVLGFAFLVSLLTGTLFGAAPAWLSFKAHPAETLRGAGRALHDGASFSQKSLVIFQAALSVVLIAGAILLTRSLANLEHQNYGVVTANRYVLRFDTQGAGYTLDRLPALYHEIQDRFNALPGIASASLAEYSPLQGENWSECVIQQGHAAPRQGEDCDSTWNRVDPRFLESVGVPIVRGRNFTDQDTNAGTQVAIVNEAFAKKFFPDQDPIGRHFGVGGPKYSGSFEIVGVFRDFMMNLQYSRSRVHPVFLRPLAQQFTGYTEPNMVRSETRSMYVDAMILDFHAPPPNVDALVRDTLSGIDPNLTIQSLRTFGAQVRGNFDQERLVARLTGLFGLLALVLASVGLYGVMSYFVARRTGEVGVRMALGATRGSVLAMVMRDALGQILIGIALGVPAALVAGYYMSSQLFEMRSGHYMSSQLFGVRSYDPLSLAAAVAVLGISAALAAFIPARRAAAIEPMKALRIE